jgi:hypothetical protein
MGLRYNGIHPSESSDSRVGRLLLNKATAEETIDNFSVSQPIVNGSITTKKSNYVISPVDGSANALTTLLPPPNAEKTGFADLSYLQTQNELRMGSLNCAINPAGVTNPVGTTYNTEEPNVGTILKPALATTDANGLIPLAQLPSMGSGYLVGPYGYTRTYTGGSTASGTFRFAEWNIQQPNIGYFQPMVFMIVQANSEFLGRPVIEVRISESQPTATGYSTSHPLVARGVGKSFRHKLPDNTSPYNIQTIAVMPCSAANGQSFSGTTAFSSSYGAGTTKNFYLTAWMLEAGVAGFGVSAMSSVVSGSAFLLKMST